MVHDISHESISAAAGAVLEFLKDYSERRPEFAAFAYGEPFVDGIKYIINTRLIYVKENDLQKYIDFIEREKPIFFFVSAEGDNVPLARELVEGTIRRGIAKMMDGMKAYDAENNGVREYLAALVKGE
jgi:hypothetical protein